MDVIRLYLQDIGRIPLLSREEEVALSVRSRRGDSRARKQLIQSNLRLVINIAKRYNFLGIPLADLIEEGNIGLMRAIEKFNPKKGFRLSTYAAWWIKQNILRYIANQGKTIRLPVYLLEIISHLKKVREKLAHSLGRDPSDAELARAMRLSVKKMQEIKSAETKTISLDSPVGGTETMALGDLISDENAPLPSDEISKFLQHERVINMLERLPRREQEVLTLRYGLKDDAPRTLEETASHFGLTRERVRQIERKALYRLKRIAAKEKELV